MNAERTTAPFDWRTVADATSHSQTMGLSKTAGARHPRAATQLLLSVPLLILMAASAAAEPVWVLQSARTNPDNEPTRFDAGITPGYYEARFAGTFKEIITSEEELKVKEKWVDHEQMEYDVELSAKMTPPENILKPGKTIMLTVHFANSGTVKVGNPGISFQLGASDGTLKGPSGANYFPWDPRYAGPPPAVWNLTVPAASDRELTIDASLLNHGAARVRWTYRIEDRDLRVPPRTWEELLPDYFRPERAIVSRGTVIQPRGTVEHYVAAFDRWVGPLRSDTELRTGDRVRTGPDSTCRVVFRNPEGKEDTITIGADTLLEVPEVERELSIAAQLLIGMIKIKHAILNQPGPSDSPFVVRTPDVVIGTRGTEYVVSTTADHSTNVYVKEGQVGVFAIPSEKLTEIGPGQKVTISPEGLARVGRMGSDEFAGLLQSNPLDGFSAVRRDADKARIAKGIPVPGAEFTSLRFFESAKTPPPFGERTYADTFPKSRSRYIHWEFRYTHPAPGRRINYKVVAIYVKVNGSRLAKYAVDQYADTDWVDTRSSAGYGWAEPGHWEPGRYRVDILINDKYVTSGEFEITPN